MAQILCVYKEVEILKAAGTAAGVAIVSYDEKPGVQAIGATAPKPGVHAAFARDHEYKRHGTLTRERSMHSSEIAIARASSSNF